MDYNTKSYAGYGTSPSAWEEYLVKIAPEKTSQPELICSHEWKEIRLVISSVFDCTKCGCKKEQVEK